MTTSLLIRPASGSAARERSVRSTRLQKRLDATARVLGIEEANRDVEQQRVGSGDPIRDMGAKDLLHRRERPRRPGRELTREFLGGGLQLLAREDPVDRSPFHELLRGVQIST